MKKTKAVEIAFKKIKGRLYKIETTYAEFGITTMSNIHQKDKSAEWAVMDTQKQISTTQMAFENYPRQPAENKILQ